MPVNLRFSDMCNNKMLGSWDSCPDTELLNVSQTLAHSQEIMVYNVGSIFVFSVKLPSVEFAVWHVRKFWTMEQHGYQLFTSEMLKTSGHSQFSWRIMNRVLTGIPECLRLFWGHLLKGQRRLCCRRITDGSPLEALIWWQSNPPKVSALRGKETGPAMTSCSTGLLTDGPSVPPRLPLTKPWRISTGGKQTKHSCGYLSFIKRKKCHGNMWCVQTRSEHPKE